MRYVLLAMAAGCGGGGGTEAGSVGAPQDLRKHLPPEIAARAPADDAATKHDFLVDLNGVGAKVVWRTFDDGANKYVLSIGLEVVTPADGVVVERSPAMTPQNAGTPAAVIETVRIQVGWRKATGCATTAGNFTVTVGADGRGERAH